MVNALKEYMKRWAIGSIAFFATLAIGIIIVWPMLAWQTRRPEPNSQEITPTEPTEPIDSDEDAIDLDGLEVFDDDIDEPDKFSCRLLITGSAFHAEQIKIKNGEKWLGLFKNGKTYSLKPATVKIKLVPDEILHGNSSEQKGKLTGKSIGVASGVKPVFLLKNSRIRPGRVETFFRGVSGSNFDSEFSESEKRPTFLDKHFSQTYKLGGKVYNLKVIKAKNKRSEPILALILEGDGKRQLLHTFWTRGEGEHGEKNWLGSVGTLYWVGDLDRDNKPDFYLSLFAHEIISERFILLSSKAKKGKLVKKTALFSTSGCC